ncbi:MAG: PSD1 domain-containing protein [Planctomycetes bacterium]|nr:PSD1 domain-containing protein [Planctomycetota bacterium]
MTFRRFVLLALVHLGYIASWGRTGEPPPTAEQVRFFETSIRPLLVEHCIKCHGPKKQKADLRLDARERILKGGYSGPAVTPGHPERSLLIKAISHRDKDLKMPPKTRLSDRQIADLTRWVKMGAPFPGNVAKAKGGTGRDHWAFQAPRDPPAPPVKNRKWPRSPLDHFVLAHLEAKGLAPAPPADRRTLIRRATFDLIGLPPTPAEVDAFVADKSADAFARVIDRLLASPHYGERWARHWLDVARYADSNGLDENVAFGNAWRYRDYVVAAFNQDKPYDQFLIEQLAGDLLPSPLAGEGPGVRGGNLLPSPLAGEGQGVRGTASRNERLIATGFLALGPKVLAEGDEKKMELDIIDEQIDTFGRALMGLTLGCARCHDHKFDPITTRDYHGLAGIFTSTRTMESFKRVARWHEHPLISEDGKTRQAIHIKKVNQHKQAIQQLAAEASARVKSESKPGTTLPKDLESLYPAKVRLELKRLRAELAALEKSAPEMPTAMGVTEAKVADVPVFLRGDHLKPGKIVPRQVPAILAGDSPTKFDSTHSGRLELARWLVRPENPLTARVMVNRIWRWHFGQGIVPTPDNFGLLGEAPANQPLLDWLAHRFVKGKWSIKAMHRTIMLSSTYQMSSAANPQAARADPENRLIWRANVKRLEAEAIRDNLLAVSGMLDPKMGGSLLHVKNRGYLFDHTSKDSTKYDSRRRSLYLPVIRNNVYDVFQLFDFPDPAVANGDRATTTVATQALFLMNSDWVARLCDHWAESLLKDARLDNAGRVRQIYRQAYAREATATETSQALELVRSVEKALTSREANAERRRQQGWACLCQTVVSANEFVYVR